MYLSKDKALEALGLNPSVKYTHQEIKRAYKKKALQYHPDKNKGSNDEFIQIKLAYEILVSDENDPDFDFFFHKIVKVFSTFMMNLMRPSEEEFHDAKTTISSDIVLNLSIPLHDLYREEGKKLRVKYFDRNKEMKHHVIYLSFQNYSLENIFQGKGDWDQFSEEYGDLIVNIEITEMGSYIINNFVDKHDLIKTIPISVSDYYYGVDITFDHFDEEIHLCCKPVDISSECTVLLKEKGLKTDDKRGDLFIIFQVDLHKYDSSQLMIFDLRKIFPSLV